MKGIALLVAGGLLSLALMTGSARADLIPLTATLDGAQEVPPNVSVGTGAASLLLNTTTGTLFTSATFANLLAPTTALDIAEGPPGTIGPVLHTFTVAPLGVTSGAFTDLWTGLTPAQVTAVESGNMYINISTTAFPAGEIRGQITPATTAVPEPSTLTLLGIGSLSLLGYGWRRRKQAIA